VFWRPNPDITAEDLIAELRGDRHSLKSCKPGRVHICCPGAALRLNPEINIEQLETIFDLRRETRQSGTEGLAPTLGGWAARLLRR
jgi:hypothetical protein